MKRLHILSLSGALLVAGCDSVQDYFGRKPDEPVRPSTVVTPGAVKGSYIVQRGDTVYQLARDQNVPVRALIEANRLEAPYILLIGQRLEIPSGRTHTVARGETLYAVSRKYGVDVSSLVKSNNIPAPYILRVGQTLNLPAAVATEDGKAPAASPPLVASAPPQPISSVPVASTASQPGAAIEVAPLAPPTPANQSMSQAATPAPVAAAPVAPVSTPHVTQPITPAPAPATAAPTPITPAVPVPVPPKPQDPAPAKVEAPAAVTPPPAQVAAAPSPEVPKPTEPATPVPSVEPPATPSTPKPQGDTVAVLAAPPARGGRTFQWPVTGRVIATYGEMGSGLRNDGLNIAANKGTPIRAAENGVVVYAGDEIKGFGNLLLIRHADGFTTAYAHCDALLVNRGDTIRRGQVIARVGDTGHVSRPQLHFEIRKGTQAVDPQEYLSRPTASVPGVLPPATAPPAG